MAKKQALADNVPNYEFQYPKRREVVTEDAGKDLVKVLVWQLPVRIFHWITVFSIATLIVTGLYIGKPLVNAMETNGADLYIMGWVRIVHFITAFVFTATFFVRLYWFLVGNKYSVFAVTKKGYFRGILEALKYYLFMKNKKPHYVGHNPLAQFAYWVMFAGCALIQILTGFYMYTEPQGQAVLTPMFKWVGVVFGGSYNARMVHHWATWAIILFVIIHVYLAWREDYLAKNATMSSIFSGWKIEKKTNVKGVERNEKQNHNTRDRKSTIR